MDINITFSLANNMTLNKIKIIQKTIINNKLAKAL